MTFKHRASVVIPTFSRPSMLTRNLEALSSQSCKEFEVIVVDDCSPEVEAYEAAVKRFEGILSLRYFRMQTRKGAPFCRNFGASHASAPFLAFVDDDDFWRPHKLERQIEVMENASALTGLSYTWTEVVDENLDKLYELRAQYSGDCLRPLLKQCFIPSPSAMVSKAAFLEAGGFDESLPYCQDWDLWIRLAKCGYGFECIPEFLAFYCMHDGTNIEGMANANLGYKKIYSKHFWSFLIEGEFRHLARFVRLSLKK